MKKTVLAMLAGMVCAISFACISGGDDYSSEGNITGLENMPGDSSVHDDQSGYSLNVQRVPDVNYIAYDFTFGKKTDGVIKTEIVRMIIRGVPNKTLVYIAEVNGVKHVESPSVSKDYNSDSDILGMNFSSTVYNMKTLHLPLRVKIGLLRLSDPCCYPYQGDASEICEFVDNFARGFFDKRREIYVSWLNNVRNEVCDFSLVLQYQVAGSSSWTTVSRTRFKDIQQRIFDWGSKGSGLEGARPKYYFLNGKIDGDFPAGTTLLIRIVAESINNQSPTELSSPLSGWESFGEKTTWTKKMTDVSFTEHNSYGSGPSHYFYISGFAPGLNSLYSVFDSTGNLNWCPLQWMAVKIGEGRRPE